MLEKTTENYLYSKEIKPISLKGNQPWILTGKTDAEAEAPVFGHLMQTDYSLEKSLMLGKIVVRGEEGITEWCWMVSPMQWTWTWANFGRCEGQGGLACCSPWGQSDMTVQLNNNNLLSNFKILSVTLIEICFEYVMGLILGKQWCHHALTPF